MNCPKCDLQTLPDQKVCRACGAGLQLVTQPLADYAAVSDLEGTPAITFKAERQRTNKMTASRKPNNLFTIYDLRFTVFPRSFPWKGRPHRLRTNKDSVRFQRN